MEREIGKRTRELSMVSAVGVGSREVENCVAGGSPFTLASAG